MVHGRMKMFPHDAVGTRDIVDAASVRSMLVRNIGVPQGNLISLRLLIIFVFKLSKQLNK